MRKLNSRLIQISCRFLKQQKHIKSPLTWLTDRNNANFLSTATVPVLDKNNISIRNLYFQATYNQTALPHNCKYVFTLFYKEAKDSYPIYQLEIMGKHKISHQDKRHNEVFYGPHLHFSDTQIEMKISHPDCEHFEQWLELYCQIGKITLNNTLKAPPKVTPPTELL